MATRQSSLSLLTSRLAAQASTRQLDGLARANAAADAADQAVSSHWLTFIRWLGSKPPATQVRARALGFLQGLYLDTQATVAGELAGLVRWGHDGAAAHLAGTLPPAILQGALLAEARLQEDAPRRPGVLLGLNRGRFVSLPGRRREPAIRKPNKATQQAEYAAMLFKPPDEAKVREILRRPMAGQAWEQELAEASTLAGFRPDQMANLIAQAFSRGESPRQIAQAVLPAVSGVKSTARRVARTYGMQVAHHAGMEAHQALGNLVTGYQIHAQLDQNTRPWHAARSGTIYYRDPQEGQKGLAQMPNPPLEAEDPRERPPGTPMMAWHCRCWLSPVLTVPDWVDDPEVTAVFETAEGLLVPDPSVYSDWFDQVDERRRKLAVGVRNYEIVRGQLTAPPRWEHFLDPRTGGLVPRARLQAETDEERQERVGRATALIDERRRLIAQVAKFGFSRS